MRRLLIQGKRSYSFTPLQFSVRPTVIPVDQTTYDLIALIGAKHGQETPVICETIEEAQLFWDLANKGELRNLSWGILKKNH